MARVGPSPRWVLRQGRGMLSVRLLGEVGSGGAVGGGPSADVHLLAVLLSSTSATRSCHPAAPSPHSVDPQVRAGV